MEKQLHSNEVITLFSLFKKLVAFWEGVRTFYKTCIADISEMLYPDPISLALCARENARPLMFWC